MPRNYKTLIPEATHTRAESYLQKLQNSKAEVGNYLSEQLSNVDLHKLDGTGLLRKLCNTKKPQIFAESEVFGDGSDWTLSELQLLGDTSIATEVTIYDDGQHTSPVIHNVPFKGTLVFTSGALLRNDNGFIPANWTEVVSNNQLDFERYY